VLPVKYEQGFRNAEDSIPHSHLRENLKLYVDRNIFATCLILDFCLAYLHQSSGKSVPPKHRFGLQRTMRRYIPEDRLFFFHYGRRLILSK
jgi:hypothetical protein